MTVNISKPSINIREKLAELDKPSGIAGEAVLRADSVQDIRNNINAGRKNLLINGGMQISQRGTYTSATAYSGSGTYLLDRWKMTLTGSGSSATLQDLGGSVKLLAGSTFTGTTRAYQKLEDKGLYKLLSNKTVTFSAWVKSNTANARIEAWISAWVGFDQTHSGSGEWEKLSATYTFGDLTGHPDGNVNFQVGIDGFNSVDCAVTSGDYVEFKEVQLELGSVATDFEHRSYGEELALCQRYYYQEDGNNRHDVKQYHPSYRSLDIRWLVQMRAAPTFTYTYSGGDTLSNVLTDRGVHRYVGAGVAANIAYYIHSIRVDAEL